MNAAENNGTAATTKHVTLYSPDIECDGCARSIEDALGALAGVRGVAVDVAARRVQVNADAALATGEVIAALDKAGFSAEPLAAATTT